MDISEIMQDTIPKAGKIKIQTSGCPKIQKMCTNNKGSPPPAGSKKEEKNFYQITTLLQLRLKQEKPK